MNTIAEVKKLSNGKLATRMEGEKSFKVVEDDEIALYLIFIMAQGKDYELDTVCI